MVPNQVYENSEKIKIGFVFSSTFKEFQIKSKSQNKLEFWGNQDLLRFRKAPFWALSSRAKVSNQVWILKWEIWFCSKFFYCKNWFHFWFWKHALWSKCSLLSKSDSVQNASFNKIEKKNVDIAYYIKDFSTRKYWLQFFQHLKSNVKSIVKSMGTKYTHFWTNLILL